MGETSFRSSKLYSGGELLGTTNKTCKLCSQDKLRPNIGRPEFFDFVPGSNAFISAMSEFELMIYR